MKKIFFCLLFLTPLIAQKSLTIQQATSGQYREFYPKTLTSATWRGNTKDISYLEEYKSFKIKSEKTGWKEKEISNLQKLTNAVDFYFGKKNPRPNSDALSYFPYDYSWVSDTTIIFDLFDDNYNFRTIYSPFSNQIKSSFHYSNKAEQIHYSPMNNSVAFTIENNIVLTKGENVVTVITNDENKSIVNGSENTHRQEFGINKGIFWSPKGNFIAYYRKDESMVKTYPLVNTSTRIAEANPLTYPMAGEKSEEVTLVVYDISNNKKVTMKTGEPVEQFLTCVSWDPTEKYIYIGVLNREQNHLKMNKYDAKTGDLVKTLFEEKHKAYVEPLHDLKFFSTKPNQFIYQTEKDGFNHLYLYNTDGTLLKQITSGSWFVDDIIGLDSKEEVVYFTANKDETIGRHVYSFNLKTNKLMKHTITNGTHSGIISKDGTRFIDYVSSTTIPNEVNVIDTKTNKSWLILKAENPYNGYDLPKMEMVTLTSADGKTPLYGRIIYPSNFDQSKKYPTLIYVYGGPHAQMVTNSWLGGASLFEYYVASQGYVVFTLDNRGSDGRGMEFENVIHRNLGVNEMADQLKGVEYLKSKSFVDANKMGVWGWSFGGFMTISLMTTYPDIFKAAVAGGPVCDWKYYEVMYGERYMDTPQENPDGYKNTSLLNKAENLKGRLLVIHGAQDDVVLMQHSMEFINACIKKGKQVDYFLYPDHKHNVRGKDRVHLNQKILDYFNVHLK